MAALPAASAQPLSAFALVESALLPLSGDGRILTKCLEFFGDTPTILMSLLDGKDDGDDGEDDGGDDITGTAGPIWSHVVSFMDAFTLASLDMTCRDAYFADEWKTDDRWVEWDQALFEHAKGTHSAEGGLCCRQSYAWAFRWSRGNSSGRNDVTLPEVFEHDGQSRYRVLRCAAMHLSALRRFEVRLGRLKDVADNKGLCKCPIGTGAVIGHKSDKSGWRKIPGVNFGRTVWDVGAPRGRIQRVSNLR